MDKKELLKGMSAKERAALMRELKQEEQAERLRKREAYEQLRRSFVREAGRLAEDLAAHAREFCDWMDRECGAFREVMDVYGQLRSEDQQSYTLADGDFKVEVSSNKVKRFDERADLAAQKLMDFLARYIRQSERGKDDPMYQLAMSLLERNRQGDLDYKSISKLYELEDKFRDDEYTEIMQLFRESNVVQGTARNYYFWRRDGRGVWCKIEPSFCRL